MDAATQVIHPDDVETDLIQGGTVSLFEFNPHQVGDAIRVNYEIGEDLMLRQMSNIAPVELGMLDSNGRSHDAWDVLLRVEAPSQCLHDDLRSDEIISVVRDDGAWSCPSSSGFC